jgi:hypothetical protein
MWNIQLGARTRAVSSYTRKKTLENQALGLSEGRGRGVAGFAPAEWMQGQTMCCQCIIGNRVQFGITLFSLPQEMVESGWSGYRNCF